VHARLRLPTYFCAPNFAYLMVADARAALAEVPGVAEAHVTLDDHFASDEINDGVGADRDFAATFPGETEDGELAELRSIFDRKAFVVRQERLAQALVGAGYSAEALTALRLGDLPTLPETTAYLERRRTLRLDLSDDAPFLLRPNGEPIGADDAPRQLRFARTVRVSIEGNADLCRGLLSTRYGLGVQPERAGEGMGR
jgi:hypothetical protein